MKRAFLWIALLLAGVCTASAASLPPFESAANGPFRGLLDLFLPKVPAYPYQNPQAIDQQGRAMSLALEAYVKEWFAGRAAAALPSRLLPQGMRPGMTAFHLVRYDRIDPTSQWIVRQNQPIDLQAVRQAYPDPHATYLFMPQLFAPFGSKVIVEGEFPYSRFFDIQISPPLDGRFYYYDKSFGIGEVPLVDADITPLADNVNPFRSGADRLAPNRRYRTTFALAQGDPAALNPQLHPPFYRAPGTVTRVGGAIEYHGAWGVRAPGTGVWDTGALWVRYYGIDRNRNFLGGVALPKVWYELPDGRRYFIAADISGAAARANGVEPVHATLPKDPAAANGPDIGWFKGFGIFRSIAEGLSRASHRDGASNKAYVRALDLGVSSKGQDQPPPGNWETNDSSCVFIHYLGRGMSLGSGKVIVLTGTLPTFPNTRGGAPIMANAQMRYWSITGYESSLQAGRNGGALNSLMDDEISLDPGRRYIIAYSRPLDRPANATAANGVTWVNWGPVAYESWTIRWMSVAPEWDDETVTPSEARLPWASTDWASANYDNALIGINGRSAALAHYLPEVHYLTKREFEALGAPLSADRIPHWR